MRGVGVSDRLGQRLPRELGREARRRGRPRRSRRGTRPGGSPPRRRPSVHASVSPPRSAAATLSGWPSSCDRRRQRIGVPTRPCQAGGDAGRDRGGARPQPAVERDAVSHLEAQPAGIGPGDANARTKRLSAPRDAVRTPSPSIITSTPSPSPGPIVDLVSQLERDRQAVEPRPQVGGRRRRRDVHPLRHAPAPRPAPAPRGFRRRAGSARSRRPRRRRCRGP